MFYIVLDESYYIYIASRQLHIIVFNSCSHFKCLGVAICFRISTYVYVSVRNNCDDFLTI